MPTTCGRKDKAEIGGSLRAEELAKILLLACCYQEVSTVSAAPKGLAGQRPSCYTTQS